MRTTYALSPSREYLRGWLFQSDRFALAHGLNCLRAFEPSLVAEGMARVDALVAGGTNERAAVATVAERMADEIEAAAKSRPALRSIDPGYSWQAGNAAAERATAEANAVHWLRTVAYELDAMAAAITLPEAT